ncbi:MAG: chemotaxis response regulator protein-glutamate methylesterase [Acidobacteriota bacterium]
MLLRQEKNRLRVIIVDDSAVVRQVLTELLSHTGEFTVEAAANPIIAIDKMKKARPDVIVLDLEMPQMDGLTFLRKIMSEDPIPVVICSGLTSKNAETALHALEEGAIEVINKPRFDVKGFLHESVRIFINTIRDAAQIHLPRRTLPTQSQLSADTIIPLQPKPLNRATTEKVIAIGASTGGTEALRLLLEAMPPDAPGIVIVQHMPAGFTANFARRLDQICRIEVKEAASGDRVKSGRALIAPGDHHTLLVRNGGVYAVEVVDGPLISHHRPSVDALFRSVAQTAAANAIGVIMTGMGNDGAAGLLEMKKAGATTIAQDEASCVVYSMPKEAIARGGVDEVVALHRITPTILQKLL